MVTLDPTVVSAPVEPAIDAEILRQGLVPKHWRTEIVRLGRKLARGSRTATPQFAEELTAAGLVALWRAAEAFDPSHGSPFENYARRSVRNAMLSELRALEEPTSRAKAVPLDAEDVPPDALTSSEETPHGSCERREARRKVRSWLRTCGSPLEEVFTMLYEQGLTQREAAAELGVSQPRISQYHTKLIQSGRKALGSLNVA